MSQTIGDLRSTSGKVVKEGSLKPKTIDKLAPQQRAWSDKVIRALGLTSSGSQGRLIAGAVASAEEIELNGSEADKQTARTLRKNVLAAGTPPWKDTKKALAAGSAKAHLDILSIPDDQRALQRFGGPGTQNETFVIKRKDASGPDQQAFLCKPAGEMLDQNDTRLMPSGGPLGGEVAREALSSRAAQLLSTQTGIDIGMPETHVVTLDASLVPDRRTGTTAVTCSVQEFRPAVGDMKNATPQRKKAAKPEQVAALAVFDTLTLNTDRHGGNILIGANGDLIPIDQGESFAESSAEGRGRMKGAMGGPQNALLSLPAAHEPFSPAMLKKLKGLSPDKYADGLKNDQKEIGRANPDMAGKVSSGAIDQARRAALFVKLAVANKPPLNPAAVQTVLGANAEELFSAPNDKQFQALAKRLIAHMAPAQAAIKEVQTASDIEYETLINKMAALGWNLAPRSGAPDRDNITDPLLALNLVQRNIQRPRDDAAADKLLADLREGKGNDVASVDQALRMAAAVRIDTIAALIPLVPPNEALKFQNGIDLLKTRALKDALTGGSLLLETVEGKARTLQTGRLTTFNATHQPAEIMSRGLAVSSQAFVAWESAKQAVERGLIIFLGQSMDELDTRAANGEFKPASAAAIRKKLRTMADALMLGNDADLTAGLQAAQANDPFTADDRLKALTARAKSTNLSNKPLKQMQAEFDAFSARYTGKEAAFDSNRFQTAVAAKDVGAAVAALASLKGRTSGGQLMPTEKEFDDSIFNWDVPDDDADRVAAVTAIRANDIENFRKSFQRLEGRRLTNEFGDGSIRQIRAELDRLLLAHTIPPQHTDLLELRDCIVAPGKPMSARFALERLESLAAAGAF